MRAVLRNCGYFKPPKEYSLSQGLVKKHVQSRVKQNTRKVGREGVCRLNHLLNLEMCSSLLRCGFRLFCGELCLPDLEPKLCSSQEVAIRFVELGFDSQKLAFIAVEVHETRQAATNGNRFHATANLVEQHREVFDAL